MTYIYWLTIFVWFPLAALWAFNWQYLTKYRKTFMACIGWALLFSIPWDLWAVRTQIWAFPSETNLGIWILDLPIEEYLFMVFVTFLITTMALLVRRHLLAHPS